MTKDRREFLLKLGIGSGIAALGAQTVASLRSLVPERLVRLARRP